MTPFSRISSDVASELPGVRGGHVKVRVVRQSIGRSAESAASEGNGAAPHFTFFKVGFASVALALN